MVPPDVPAPRSNAAVPSARARIRTAALELFAAQGVDRTTVRAIAARAAVSPALVLHHYASKQGLRTEVDATVSRRLADALAAGRGTPGADPLADITAAVAAVLSDVAVREYVRRVLSEAGPAGRSLFDQLFAVVSAELVELTRAGLIRPDLDPALLTSHVLFLLLGPLAFAPLIEAYVQDVYSATGAERRTAFTLDVLRRGLFRP